MGNASARELSAAERGRRPTDQEMLVLFQLQRALFRRLVASPEVRVEAVLGARDKAANARLVVHEQHLALLQRLWAASLRRQHQRNVPAFALVSERWRLEAGFSEPNPAADLSPTGELGLRCLVFFVETYPAETAMMRRGRGGYPFAKAAVALTRALSQILQLVDASGNPGPFPVTDALFWQLLEHETSFYQLFALAFLLFEELFCEEVGRQPWLLDESACPMAVADKLVAAVKLQVKCALKQAPLRLRDLQTLCRNGKQVLQRAQEAQRPSPSSLSSSGEKPFEEQNAASRWSQHQAVGRKKSLREICENWGKDGELAMGERGAGYRLQPRAPEVQRPATAEGEDEKHRRKEEPELAADLFAGLVTKAMAVQSDLKQEAHAAAALEPARSS